MASVSSLDADMRALRAARYTPAAAAEVRTWIESTLRSPLPAGDLLVALKDGVALCQLANLLLPPPGIRYKSSSMPFIQMENISHFLRACEMEPLALPAHDRFLTVDLYEAKDPAQVLQCLSAFSRRAHQLDPVRFADVIGPKKPGVQSPTTNTRGGGAMNGYRTASPTKAASAARALSPALTGGSTGSQGSNSNPPSRSSAATAPVSSWSSRKDEGVTQPAWNIHQYGYMGGASQGNQGISFGARRQITSPAPAVPTLAEKERKRKEKAEEERRAREEAEARRAEEAERERADEERRWEEETRRLREEERRRVEEQKRQWAEQERKWKEEEEARRREEERIKAALMPKKPPEKPRVSSSSILRGQTLSQYQREQHDAVAGLGRRTDGLVDESELHETPEQKRVRELEKQLEEARERERVYQAEREGRLQREKKQAWGPGNGTGEVRRPESKDESDVSWVGDERDFMRQEWQSSREPLSPSSDSEAAREVSQQQQRSLPSEPSPPFGSSRPLPLPTTADTPTMQHQRPLPFRRPPSAASPGPFDGMASASSPTQQQRSVPQSDSVSSISSHLSNSSPPSCSPLGRITRPLPTPDKELKPYSSSQPQSLLSKNRTDAYLSTHRAPETAGPHISMSREAGDTEAEQAALRDGRRTAQARTKAGAWASSSLLEREMERERERQREWEEGMRERGIGGRRGIMGPRPAPGER